MNKINNQGLDTKKIMDFYMMTNELKYLKWKDTDQSIADHIYGMMVLAVAFYSEYKIPSDLGHFLKEVLLRTLNDQKNLENNLEKKFSFSEDFTLEENHFLSYLHSLDHNLWKFCDQFIKEYAINLEDSEELLKLSSDKRLFDLAKEKSSFLSFFGDDEKDLEIFRFYFLNHKLKTKIRSGWNETHWHISNDRVERISEHIVGTIALALAIDHTFPCEIDLDKVLTTLSIHEIGEILIGDITPFDGKTAQEKQEIEQKAMRKVVGNLSKGEELIDILFSFDERKTDEAKFAYYCDKLEADIQSKVYQDMGCHHPLTEQENNVVFKSTKVRKMLEEGAETAFDIWYEWDKPIYTDSPIFKETLKYIKRTKIK